MPRLDHEDAAGSCWFVRELRRFNFVKALPPAFRQWGALLLLIGSSAFAAEGDPEAVYSQPRLIRCSRVRTSASAGRGTGWMSCITRTRTATSGTRPRSTRDVIAITSCAPSTPTCRFRQLVLEQIVGDFAAPRVDAASDLNESLLGPMALRLGERRHGNNAPRDAIITSVATRFSWRAAASAAGSPTVRRTRWA